MSVKYYKIIKEHPAWEVGAILSNEISNSDYYAIDDIWVKTGSNGKEFAEPRSSANIVEYQPEWFERVYKTGAKNAKFVSKELAIKAYADTNVEETK